MTGRFLLLALLILVACGKEEEFWCGVDATGNFGLGLTGWLLRRACGEHYDLINGCCRSHDFCYSGKKLGQFKCDTMFFKCLKDVARDCPRTYGVIRKAVMRGGHVFYPNRFKLTNDVNNGNLL